jgi:hypothetical protein
VKIISCPKGHDHTITTERRQVGEAYARNGNLGNPTPRYMFDALVDGKIVASQTLRRNALAIAQDFITTGEVDE